jgi:hypothetical protein
VKVQLLTPGVAVEATLQLAALNVPVEFVVNETEPVGKERVPEVWVTVAVQLEAWLSITGLVHVRAVVVGLWPPVIVTDIAVEFVMRLFVPPFPIMFRVYVPAVPEIEHVLVPGVVIVTVAEVQVTVRVPGPPVKAPVTVIVPANPLLAGTLSRLVKVMRTWAVFPWAKLRLVELLVWLHPSTWIVKVPPVFVTSPVAAIADLYRSWPVPVAVKLISLTIVCPTASGKAGGSCTVIPVVPTTLALVVKVIVPEYPPWLWIV